MYIPPHFAEERLPVLHQWMRENSFATLVSVVAGAPFATHLPVLLDDARGEFGTLRAHMAKVNPHWHSFGGEAETLVIFQGPHGYITPSWYQPGKAVPTWNYTAVHAYGRPRILDGEPALQLLLDQVKHFEADFEAPWDVSGHQPGYILGMTAGIVAFEIEITRLEGKGKLSQNRPADRGRVIAELESLGNDGLAAAMRAAGPLPMGGQL